VLVAQCGCELRPVQLEEFVDLYLSVSIDRVERALFFLDGAEKVVEPGGQQDWRGQRHGQRQCQQHALLSGWDCYRRRLDTWLYWLWLWLWIRCLWLRLPRRELGARGPRDASDASSRSAGISAAASSSVQQLRHQRRSPLARATVAHPTRAASILYSRLRLAAP
jgi:hypothetical protein